MSHLTLPTSFSFETASEPTPELPGPELRGGRATAWGKVSPKETRRGAQNSITRLDHWKVMFGETPDEPDFLTNRSQWKYLSLSLSLSSLISRQEGLVSVGNNKRHAPAGLRVVRDRQSKTQEAARKALPHQAEEWVGPELVSPKATVACPALHPAHPPRPPPPPRKAEARLLSTPCAWLE